MEQIKMEIVEFIEKEIIPGSAVLELVPDQNLLTDGVIDSIGLQSLISFVESHFQIQIGEDQLTPENFATIDAIGSLVNSLKKTKS